MPPAQGYACGDTSLPHCSLPGLLGSGWAGMGQCMGAREGQQKGWRERGCEVQHTSFLYVCPYPGCRVLGEGWEGYLSTGASKWVPEVPCASTLNSRDRG